MIKGENYVQNSTKRGAAGATCLIVVVFGKFPIAQCEIGSCTIHWQVQLGTGLILTDNKFCEGNAPDLPLVLILHSHSLGVGLLLPCVASPILSIAAAKL